MARNRGQKTRARNGLQQLANRLPDDGDLTDLVLSLADEARKLAVPADRNCAIVGGAAVEYELRNAITRHFTNDLTPADLGIIFSSDAGAPGVLSTFDSRINLAFALGIISGEVRNELKQLKLIRNSFAHAVMPISFADPEVIHTLDQINRAARPPFGSEARNQSAPLFRYVVTCALFCVDFRDYRPPYQRGLIGGLYAKNLFANALLGTGHSAAQTDP